MLDEKINPEDLASGRVVQNHLGTFWFKTPGRTVWDDGTLEYWINGKRHRDGGPAMIWPGKQEWWFEYGKCHRIDGPARITANGDKEWVLYGQKYSEAEFNERVKCMKK